MIQLGTNLSFAFITFCPHFRWYLSYPAAVDASSSKTHPQKRQLMWLLLSILMLPLLCQGPFALLLPSNRTPFEMYKQYRKWKRTRQVIIKCQCNEINLTQHLFSVFTPLHSSCPCTPPPRLLSQQAATSQTVEWMKKVIEELRERTDRPITIKGHKYFQ